MTAPTPECATCLRLEPSKKNADCQETCGASRQHTLPQSIPAKNPHDISLPPSSYDAACACLTRLMSQLYYIIWLWPDNENAAF